MSVYTDARSVTDLKDCYFYHTMYLPSIGKIEGDWDLHNLSSYLGEVNFKGRRVLDVGCASGVLSFYMEKQGAEVVSFDLDERGSWDMVPFAKGLGLELMCELRKSSIRKLNNAYWLAHRLLDSRSQVVYGNVYDIPEAIGPVDIAVYGSILLHMRDPFLALQSGLKLARHNNKRRRNRSLTFFQTQKRWSRKTLGGIYVRNGSCVLSVSLDSKMSRSRNICKGTTARTSVYTRLSASGLMVMLPRERRSCELN
jgi:hypothetical protein